MLVRSGILTSTRAYTVSIKCPARERGTARLKVRFRQRQPGILSGTENDRLAQRRYSAVQQPNGLFVSGERR